MPTGPRVPFTRLPQTDQVTSDLYDKTASIAVNTDANAAAIAANKSAAAASAAAQNKQIDTLKGSPAFNAKSVLAVRRVSQSAYLQLSDYTVIFLVTSPSIATLPNCRASSGQNFTVKNDAASTSTVTLNSVGNELVDGAAASATVLTAGQSITVQSDGFNWITILSGSGGGGGGGTVTHSGLLTLDQPVFGNAGADIKVGTKSGNTNEVMSATGAFVPGNVVITDASGNAIDSGSPPSGPIFVDNETPVGMINSSNVTFTLAHTPSPSASLLLYLNGVLQFFGVNYTLATATITYTVAPTTGMTHVAYYRR
jgi:hypothetical protein